MVRSMTGFGHAHYENETLNVSIEVRSVNNRFLKINTRLPDLLVGHEAEIEKLVRQRVSRGTVTLNVACECVEGEREYGFDVDLLKSYYSALLAISKEVGSSADISLSSLVTLPGVVQRDKRIEAHARDIWPKVAKLAEQALDELMAMRLQEGQHLADELAGQATEILERIKTLEARAPQVAVEYRERLRERLEGALDGTSAYLSEEDLHREVAMFAERADIAEEITRLRSHVEQLKAALSNGGPSGRKLDFIAQEMFREANTMGSKANDGLMLEQILEIKASVERLREQVANIE